MFMDRSNASLSGMTGPFRFVRTSERNHIVGPPTPSESHGIKFKIYLRRMQCVSCEGRGAATCTACPEKEATFC